MHILAEGSEVVLLVLLVVLTVFHHQVYVARVGLLVGLGVLEKVFEQGQCLRQVLVQTAEAHTGAVTAHADGVVAGQFVEGFLHFAHILLVGSHIFQIAGAVAQVQVALLAEVIHEAEREETVLCVLLVEQGQPAFGGAHGEVLVEVEEPRTDGFHIGVLDFV